MKFKLKALIMVMITAAAASLADANGHLHLPHGVEWLVLGISMLGTGITHAIQSYALPTTSIQGQFDYRDLLKGGINAAGNFLSMWAASYVPGTVIDWQDMVQSAGSVFVLYIIKQIVTAPKP